MSDPAATPTQITIPLSAVDPDPHQPRREFHLAGLKTLARSIEIAGQKVPVIVEPIRGGRYLLVDGERRWRACQLVKGMTTIRATVEPATENSDKRFESQVVANFCREGHTPAEIMLAVRRLHDAGRSMEQIGEMFGKSVMWVSSHSRLNHLHPDVLAQVTYGKATGGIKIAVACKLATLPHDEQLRWVKVLAGKTQANALRELEKSGQIETRRRTHPSEVAERIIKVPAQVSERVAPLLDLEEGKISVAVQQIPAELRHPLLKDLRAAADDIRLLADMIEESK